MGVQTFPLVRAGMAGTPEGSEFTSIYARIQQWCRAVSAPATASDPAPGMTPLLGFRDTAAVPDPSLPFRFIDYLQLLDWSGRIVCIDKTGAIGERAPPILRRLSIDPAAWQAMMRPTGNRFGRALGTLDHLRFHAKALGQCWIKGLRQAEQLYRSA